MKVYLVEGDSAGGSAKQGRDRRFQAILPLRGKILNVEKARFDKMLGSAEIGTMISAFGCGIGRDEYNPDNLRYHRIVLMTDADVDGAHIRTLLLTFFYRQMPELVERGHLYIAQPPLYKVKRGKREVYLLDNRALDAYLVDEVIKDTTFFPDPNKPALEAEDFTLLCRYYQRAQQNQEAVANRYPKAFLRALLRLPTLTMEELTNQEKVDQWAVVINQLLQPTHDHPREPALTMKVDDEDEHGNYHLTLESRLHGAEHQYAIGPEFFGSDAYELNAAFAKQTIGLLKKGSYLMLGEEKVDISDVADVLDHVFSAIKKSLTIQRYKGLGEMNADQLWETTMNPENRSMLQVKVDDAMEADRIFTTLMGDHVEPRKNFIEENALNADNIDY